METSGMIKKLSILAAALFYTALPSFSQQNNYESRKELAWLIKGAEPTTQDCKTIDSIITNSNKDTKKSVGKINEAIKKIRENKTKQNEELLPIEDETKQYLSLAFYAKSLAEEYKGNITEAIKQIDTCIALTPYNAELYKQRAKLYHSQEKYNESYTDEDMVQKIRFIKNNGKPVRKEEPKTKPAQSDSTIALCYNTK